MTTTISITRDQLVALASVAHAASTDDTLRAEQHVKITVSDHGIGAMASDRYVLADWYAAVRSESTRSDHYGDPRTTTFYVSAAWLKNLPQAFPAKHGDVWITATDMGALMFSNNSGEERAEISGVNFPPLERILDHKVRKDEPLAWLQINPAHVAKLAKIIPPHEKRRNMKHISLRFEPTESSTIIHVTHTRYGEACAGLVFRLANSRY